MYGRINFNRIDTTPGHAGAFAPPAGFVGDYVEYMRQCYRRDPGVRQHVTIVANRLMRENIPHPQFVGPFAENAMALCKRIIQ